MLTEPVTLVVAMKDFFSFLPGTGVGHFAAECKALTPQDKEEIKAGLTKLGYSIKD